MRCVLSQLSLRSPASRRLGGAAVLLGTSALVHIGVLLSTGGEWGGAVSFRKPITFGISFGLLLWTCGWVIDRLPSRSPRIVGTLAWVLIGSGLVEVGLITAQAWRGVPSHFNFTTPADSTVFGLMGVSIAVFSVGLVTLAAWALRRPPTDRSVRLAVWAGMALVVTGLGVGQWVIELGMDMAARLGRGPDTVLAGEAGVAKFPHAMALHGIQLFIVTVLAGTSGGLSTRARLRTVRLTVAGYGSIVLWSILHTNAGRAPLDLRGVETVLAVLGIALLGAAAAVLVAGWRARPGAATLEDAPVASRT